MKIIKVNIDNLEQLLPLFEAYREFYKQKREPEQSLKFLLNRLQNEESLIYLIFNKDNKAIGFTQLYPTFSSVTLQRIYILNDLYVVPEMRNKKVGETLLKYVKNLAKNKQWKSVILETDKDNPAQKLYEKLGWIIDDTVLHYMWKTKD